MNQASNLRRYAALSVAFVVATLTLGILGKAAQTVTVPNAVNITYNLAPGAYSAAITPASNQAVLMIGSQTAAGNRGVAMATILHLPGNFIEWTGLESPYNSGSANTEGFAATPGTHIVYLDYIHQVDVEVASADTIYIHNNFSINQTGNLELIW